MQFEYLGLAQDQQSNYEQTWAYQRKVHAEVAAGLRTDTIIFVQHAPVYTAGRRTEPQERPFDNTPVVDVDRGGKITYHGPGQLVGYPIIRLIDQIGVVDYVRRIEEVVIRALREYGIIAHRVTGRTGVWLPAEKSRMERKICAIGVRVARRTTIHGFALNVTAESASPFKNIIPCGIADAGVTTIQDELGLAPSLVEVANRLEAHLQELLVFKPYTSIDSSWTVQQTVISPSSGTINR